MSKQDEYQTVCANIRYLRGQHGLSRTAMARKLHITVKTLDLLEGGTFPERVNIGFFFYVQQVFEVSPKRLLRALLEEIS